MELRLALRHSHSALELSLLLRRDLSTLQLLQTCVLCCFLFLHSFSCFLLQRLLTFLLCLQCQLLLLKQRLVRSHRLVIALLCLRHVSTTVKAGPPQARLV